MATELKFSADENWLTISCDGDDEYYHAVYNEHNDCEGCAFTRGYHGCHMPELSPMLNQCGKTKCNAAYGRADERSIVWHEVDSIPEESITKSLRGFNGFVIYDVIREEFSNIIYENETDVMSVIETEPCRENLVVYELGKKYGLKTKIELVEV